ncbi:MAG: YciI family protein [Ilumatobacter sp.]
MKFVILIHSNPQPWGHPTGDFNAEFQKLPAEERERMDAEFEDLLSALTSSGELLMGEALADPASASTFRWADGEPIATDGPFAESKEQFAGFFMIDVADRARAEEIAARFASPGDVIELRPAMWPGGDDQ